MSGELNIPRIINTIPNIAELSLSLPLNKTPKPLIKNSPPKIQEKIALPFFCFLVATFLSFVILL